MFYITTATEKIAALKQRIRAVQGGTSASKTIGVLQNLIDAAQSDPTPTLTSIVSESFPHLRRGAMRDFKNILEQSGYFKPDRWNKTDSIYTFETGSKIEFFSADQSDKVRGPRRDRLFINEANNISFDSFDQLELRTNEYIYLDWNPTTEFWFYTEVKPERDDIDHITLNYRDNEAINPAVKRSLELRKGRKGWWQVYGEGKLGEVEGKIYKDWAIIDSVPHEARLLGYGLDFGYDPDPAVIVAIYYYNGGYIIDQVLYRTEMKNSQIAQVLLNESEGIVVADSAEPKSIAEIQEKGLNVFPAQKGADSVGYGIKFIQDLRISMTKQSVDVIKEYRNYLWETDKDGGILVNHPEHEYSHSMDAIRYGLVFLARGANLAQKPFIPDMSIN